MIIKLKLSVNHIPHIKNTKEHPKINQAKKYFFINLEKDYYYKKRKVLFANANISNEECWIKFMFGSEAYHKTMKLDMDRVKRSHWMFNIITYLSSTDPSNYDTNISIEYKSTIREVIKINLEKETYIVVIELPKKRDDIAIIVTAYTKIKKS